MKCVQFTNQSVRLGIGVVQEGKERVYKKGFPCLKKQRSTEKKTKEEGRGKEVKDMEA